MLRIDPVWMNLNLDTAKAELERAKAMVAVAQANLDKSSRERIRLEELFTNKSTSQKELDDARSAERADQAQLLSEQAQVHAAESALQRASLEVERLDVLAPFDGVVVRKMIEVGQWANAGTPLMEIVSRGRIDALIDVPERFVDTVTMGSQIQVLIEPLNMEVVGEVRSIVPDGGNAARTFPVRVSLDDLDGRLLPGMSVLARVPTMKQADTITVPRDAVLRTAQGATVWMNVGGMALPAPVQVLFSKGDRLAVEPLPSSMGPPLSPGMQVVIEGAESLFPTRPLIPLP
ncbi:MAG: efflux RND transporter periplasmic adaptor subunit [Phycisphaerales bacterium]|nr:efflux RND transporter periplasmic adaptor subunit [Phycisphaerales bacterium]